MTVKVELPPTHQPYLERGLLPADFYAYEQLLSEAEREKVSPDTRLFPHAGRPDR